MDEYFQPEQKPPVPPATVPTFVSTPLINIVTRPDGSKYAVPRFVWDADSTQAAADLAEGMRVSEVAARAGIGPGTMKKWREHPEFAARVEEHRKAFRELVWNHSIARKEVRIAKLVAVSEGIEDVIEARKKRALQATADAAAKAAAGEIGSAPFDEELTGLMVEHPTANGTEIKFDRGLVAEYRDVLKQVAIEKGEFQEQGAGANVAVQIVVPAGLPKPEDVKTVTIGRQG